MIEPEINFPEREEEQEDPFLLDPEEDWEDDEDGED